ncbi:nuclear factor, interleukin 3 regulated, member 3 [Triplophysa rosa]|uniref:nuclear factor, interleukin 3 regulated, member 3 n=1 Tax=Triplophysa rosa TaxID=992332 RepID=UPI002545C604|nr:nuclear factor, interleukin 3 regulated, member 3 [Triplophysa rosa]
MYPENTTDPVGQDEVTSFTEEAVSILTSSSMLAHSFLIHPSGLTDKDSSDTDASQLPSHTQAYIPAIHNYRPNANPHCTHQHPPSITQYGCPDGLQSMQDRANASEDGGFSISDDAVGEHMRASPYRCEEEPGCELTPSAYTDSFDEVRLVSGWQENMKGLPHKLRFKTSGGFEGAEVHLPVEMEKSSKMSRPSSQSGCRWTEGLTMPPTNSNHLKIILQFKSLML